MEIPDERESAWREDMKEIKKEIEEKERSEMKRYNTLAEIPEWARPTIEKMIDKGILKGGGKKDENGKPADLDLSFDQLRAEVWHDRAGLYD